MAKQDGHEALDSRHWLLALFIVTLAPRAILAWRRETICSDAVFYVEHADALARGDFAAGFAEIGLNLYTLLLAMPASCGLDPAAVGRWLSVLAASLTVVPLCALTARWFGRGAAAVVGLLYAFSPETLDWSAEAIRDPLFWLALVFGLHAAWRARITQMLSDHLAWGAAFASAVLLRTEGLLLAIPLVAWNAPRLGSPRAPVKLLSGLALWPLSLVAINAGLLAAGHERLELGRLDHVRIVGRWTHAVAHTPADERPTAHAAVTKKAVADAREPFTWRGLSWALRHNLLGGIGWPVALLAVLGALALDRRSLLAQLPLALLGLALLAAMSIYFWHYRELTTRYVVPLLLLALPLAGKGGAALATRSLALWSARPGGRGIVATVAASALAVVCAQGAFEGMGRSNDSRSLKKSLGEHLAARFGPGRTLLATENLERLVGYYARAEHVKLPQEVGGLDALDWLRIKQPELVVLWTGARPQRYAEMLCAPRCLGYERLSLPADFRDAVLLARRDVARSDGVAGVACQTAPHSYTSVASAGPGRGPRTARR